MKNQIIIGVTGLPASGKTTLSSKLYEAFTKRHISCTLINSDHFAKKVLSLKSIRSTIKLSFGCDPLDAEQVMNTIYKADDETIHRYTMTLKYLIVNKINEFIETVRDHVIILESALLFEYNISVNTMLLVVSDNTDLINSRTEEQIERHKILQNLQIPMRYKKLYADRVIENNGDKDMLNTIAEDIVANMITTEKTAESL